MKSLFIVLTLLFSFSEKSKSDSTPSFIWGNSISSSGVIDSVKRNDSFHFWTLKQGLDPQVESVRINPDNYEDNGLVKSISATDPCYTGYEELCCIYLEPDPINPKRPNFSKEKNCDVFEALKRNHFLENKVFYKDL